MTFLALTINACGPAFTAGEGFTEPNVKTPDSSEAGQAGDESSRETEAGRSSVSGSAGLPGTGGASGGTTSIGGSPSVAGAGAGSAVAQSRECLASFETAECASVCTGSAYPACKTILGCMREKNVPPAQSNLDPCYGEGYQDLTIAISAYKACCN